MDAPVDFLFLFAAPAAGAAAAVAMKGPRAVLAATCVAVALYIGAALSASLRVFAGAPLEAAAGWLVLDALSAFHLCVMSAVFGLSTLFAWFYFGRELDAGQLPPRLARRFGALWCAALAAMTIVFTSGNLATMWVGVELTTLATAFLIRLHVSHASLEATWKYLVICSVGVALAFLGVVLVAASARGVIPDSGASTMWRDLGAVASRLDPTLAKTGFLFVLVGFGTKAGLAPMHTWLPDAHSQAPAPVSALFSGALLNAALYCILRYLPIVNGAAGGSNWASGLLLVFGLASLLVAAAFMVFQRDVKRLLAYSSVEHIGIIAVGAALGPVGIVAALFHVLNHALSKSVAFFAAGRLGQAYGTHELASLRGVARASPLWGGALVASVFCLMGAAPFPIFLSELMVLQALAQSGAWAALALFSVGASVVFAGTLRHLMGLGWQAPGPQQGAPHAAPNGTRAEAALVVVPLAALLALGLTMPAPLRDALAMAARTLTGGA